MTELEEITAAYVACALWSESAYGYITDDGEFVHDGESDSSLESLNFGADDISAESLIEMADDCAEMIRQADIYVYTWRYLWTPDQFGHDFWLTRNGHGAGFWDRYYGAGSVTGDALTRLAHAFGTAELYVGDDGAVHYSRSLPASAS
jgi:hypothetical protein